MSKHLKPKIKLKYIKMYLAGVSREEITTTMILNNHSNNKSIRGMIELIKTWMKKVASKGVISLASKSGRPKKRKIAPGSKLEDLDKDILIGIIEEFAKAREEWLKEKKKKSKIASRLIKTFNLPIKPILEIFEIPRSTYYKSLRKIQFPNINEKYNDKILLVKKVFFNNQTAYGCRKISKVIELKYGQKLPKSTINRIMRANNLRWTPKIRTRRIDPKNTNYFRKNLIGKDLQRKIIGEVLYSDVTYLKTKFGTLYLSVILDGASNKIVGHSFSKNNDTRLVMESFKDVKMNGAIIHTDHGSTYSSRVFMENAKLNGAILSMSGIGKCLENRQVEYFFGRMKLEKYWKLDYMKMSNCKIIEELKKYFKWYNNSRIQSVLKNMSPQQFENSYYQ